MTRRKANGAKRIMAFLIDIIPIWLGMLLVYKIVTGQSPMASEPWMSMTPGQLFVRDGWLPVWILYSSIAECTPARGTFGKKMMGLQVLGPQGRPLGFGRALARNAGKLLSALPFYLGFFWGLISKSSDAWHDSLARAGVYERR